MAAFSYFLYLLILYSLFLLQGGSCMPAHLNSSLPSSTSNVDIKPLLQDFRSRLLNSVNKRESDISEFIASAPTDVNLVEKYPEISSLQNPSQVQTNSTFASKIDIDLDDVFNREKNETDNPKETNLSIPIIVTEADFSTPEATSRFGTASLDPSGLNSNVNNLFNTFRQSFQRILTTGQQGLLRAIGTIDKNVAARQERVEKSKFNLVLQGQKTAARLYDRTPQFVNRIIQAIGTTRTNNPNNGIYKQLNQVIGQHRDNSRRFFDAFEEHEYDFNNVFNNVWPTVNRHLGVPELPRMQLGWF